MLCMWIPEAEREALEADIRTAVEKADCSDTQAGRVLLTDALRRAEALASDGHPWGDHLAQLYRDAIALYDLAYTETEELYRSRGSNAVLLGAQR
jgi:hypothetical protein